MKHFILTLLSIVSIYFLGAATGYTSHKCPTEIGEKTYCTGWTEGYEAGWKDVKGKYAVCPVTPICPIPEIDKDTYQDGYNRAFKQGIKDAKK